MRNGGRKLRSRNVWSCCGGGGGGRHKNRGGGTGSYVKRKFVGGGERGGCYMNRGRRKKRGKGGKGVGGVLGKGNRVWRQGSGAPSERGGKGLRGKILEYSKDARTCDAAAEKRDISHG